MSDGPLLVKAMRDLLLADSEVTGALATYDFGGASEQAAIFDSQPIPVDAELPAVSIEIADGSPWGTRGFRGAECWIDVQIWGEKTASRAALRAAAWDIWRCLDRAEPALTGYQEVGLIARPPRVSPDPDGFPGYLIEARIRILETS